MPRPISATIHLDSIAHNISLVCSKARSSRIWAVVKANAYGHGIENVYPALEAAHGVALLEPSEAHRIRQLGSSKPILLLEGLFDYEDFSLLDEKNIVLVIHCEEQLRMLEIFSLERRVKPRSVDVYLKLNTGMNRLGIAPSHYRTAWRRIRAVEAVRSITHMTHFSDADGVPGIREQMEAFHEAASGLPGEQCVANSAGTLWHTDCHADWVRAGIVLYGASPSGVYTDVKGENLQAGMTLQSRILAIQELRAGQSVGYGSTYVAPEACRIGIVACGYADGYPRTCSSSYEHFAPVRVGECKTRTIGRVSMDMLAVDLTRCPGATVGSPVELWGKHVPIDDVAAAAGTIGYELMCALAQRVPIVVEPLSGRVPNPPKISTNK